MEYPLEYTCNINKDELKVMFDDAESDLMQNSSLDISCILSNSDIAINRAMSQVSLAGIADDIYSAVSRVNTSVDTVAIICSKLSEYKLIDNLSEFTCKRHIRWINLARPDYLHSGGTMLDVKFLDRGVNILLLSGGKRFTQYRFDECISFQKLSYDEQLVLMASEIVKS
jgi:hypothetical protein